MMKKKLRISFVQTGHSAPFTLVSPPLGLLYLAAFLRQRFPMDIQVINQRLEYLSSDQLARQILAFEPDIVGLGCMTPSASLLPGITQAIRVVRPDTLIVLGGPHVSSVGEQALANNSANAAVAGEGELAMEQLVQVYLNGDGLEHIPGLIRRTKEGEIVTNPGSISPIQDLDSLPMPAYDLIDIHQYRTRDSSIPIPDRNYISLFSSRGCPYECMYCHNIFGRKFRMHSPERIVEEIKYFTRQYGVDEIEFLDDCFNLDRRRIMDYSDQLLKSLGPVKTVFPNALRADLIDADVIAVLKQAGMYLSALALESGSPRIQKLIHKNLDIPKLIRAAELCAQNRVFTLGYAMLGFPTETAEEMQDTIRVAAESQLHIASFFLVIPFPGTFLYKYAEAHMPEKLQGISYDNVDYWRVHSNLSAVSNQELLYYNGTAYREFYLRPQRIYRILRDYPKPMYLPSKAGSYGTRLLRGIGRRIMGSAALEKVPTTE